MSDSPHFPDFDSTHAALIMFLCFGIGTGGREAQSGAVQLSNRHGKSESICW